MLYVLTGDNQYALKRREKQLLKELNASPKILRIDDLTIPDLSVALTAVSLFDDENVLVIKNLSQRKDIFEIAIKNIIKNKDLKNIILIENSLDKRTVVYKELNKNSKIEDFKQLTERDSQQITTWMQSYLADKNQKTSPKILQELIDWVGVDQEVLVSSMDRLILMEALTSEGIKQYLPKKPTDFAFNLLSLALKKDRNKLRQTMDEIKQTQEPHMLMGLLISQFINIMAINHASSQDSVAKDLGVNPYAVQSIKRGVSINLAQEKKILEILYQADKGIKTSSTDPWQAIELTLVALTDI